MKKNKFFSILKITTLILFTTFTGCDTPSNTPVIPVTPVTPSNPTTPTGKCQHRCRIKIIIMQIFYPRLELQTLKPYMTKFFQLTSGEDSFF